MINENEPGSLKTISQICSYLIGGGVFEPKSDEVASELRLLGFEVSDGSFMLPADVELLDRSQIQLHLAETDQSKFRQIEVVGCVGSTNTELMERSIHESINGCAILAELQTAGRGRYGRSWFSPVGKSLSLSMGCRLQLEQDKFGCISLVVGLGVVRALSAMGISSVQLKWPNDVLIAGAKVGGILVEATDSRSPQEFVVGVGINVGGGESIRSQVNYPVADVHDHIPQSSRNRLAAALIDQIARHIHRLAGEGFASFQDSWIKIDALLGKRVTATAAIGTITGIAQGIDFQGAMILCDDSNENHRIFSGEVTLR